MKEVGRISLTTMSKRRKIGLYMLMISSVLVLLSLEGLLGLSMAGRTLQLQLLFVGVFLGGSVLMFALHEGLHGLCFWLYTGKVKFGIKLDKWFGILPYASSPHSVLTRKQIVITALAPQVQTVVLIAMLVIAIYSNQPLMFSRCLFWLGMCSFLGGAMDMYSVVWLSKFRGSILVEDIIDGAVVYERI